MNINGHYATDTDLFMTPKITEYNGSHPVMTNVIQPTLTKYIHLNTRYATTNALTNSNTPVPNNIKYSFVLPERIKNISSMTVEAVEFPMSFYNISSYLGNNTLVFGNGTSKVSVVIPDGYYKTDSTLIGAINTAIGATVLGTTIQFSFLSTNTNKTVITSKTGITYTTLYTSVDSSGNTDKYALKTKLAWRLGFRNGGTYTLSALNDGTIQADGYCFLLFPKNLFLLMDEMNGKGNQNSFLSLTDRSVLNRNILSRMSVDTQIYPFGSLCVKHRANGLISDIRKYNGTSTHLQRFEVRMVDDMGTDVNFNGMDFTFVLKVEYE